MRSATPVDYDGRARCRQPHGFAVRLRLWVLWMLTGILLFNSGFKPPYWGERVDIEGETLLPPGESRVLRFHSTMKNDIGIRAWGVGLSVDEARAASATGVASVTVTVTGAGGPVREGSSTCEEHYAWGETDTGWTVNLEHCDVDAECTNDATPCEATVEFTMTSDSSESVTVGWSARASVDGTIGCCRNRDKVGEVSIELVP